MTESLTVAIVSDTHGYLDARVAEVVSTCDVAVHAGDIGDSEVLDAMRPRSGRIYAVLGNNDTVTKWPAGDRRELDAVPEQQTLSLPGGSLVVEHGHRIWDARHYHSRLRRRHPAARAIVYGHTHRRVCDTDIVPWVLNPGASGRVRTFGGPSCLVLEISDDRWRVQQHCFTQLSPTRSKKSVKSS